MVPTGRCPRSIAKWKIQAAEGFYHMVKMIQHTLGKEDLRTMCQLLTVYLGGRGILIMGDFPFPYYVFS